MGSLDFGKYDIVEWVKEHFPQGATCLDVGACDGKWNSILGDYLTMDAVEIFRPNIEEHHLEQKYRKVFCADIADVKYEWYDLIIFGDVIEHMEVTKAQKVIEYARPRCKDMIVAVPFQYPQDEMYGNKYERHIQDDLTPDIFSQRYPGMRMIFRPIQDYAYYVKGPNCLENKTGYSSKAPRFSVIVPTHNGADRLPESLGSVTCQTFKDYELIVVCDACTDKSGEVAEKYGATVLYVDYKRDGLTRNAGIDQATGEWVLFLDDDDHFLHEYCFEKLNEIISRLENEKPDAIDFSFIWKGIGYCVPSPRKAYVMMWARAWRRSFIGNKRMDDTQYGADNRFFNGMIYDNQDAKVYYWDFPMYYYNYMRKGSLSQMHSNAKPCLDIIITHHDEPVSVFQKPYNMLLQQRLIDFKKVHLIFVQSGKENVPDWEKLLEYCPYPYQIIDLPENNNLSVARNHGIDSAQAQFMMFLDWDDLLSDVWSLCSILSVLPTDKFDILWMPHTEEEKIRDQYCHIAKHDDDTTRDITSKIFRTEFLKENKLYFDTSITYFTENLYYLETTRCTSVKRFGKITTDIVFPMVKTYRDESMYHSGNEETYVKRTADLLKRGQNLISFLEERKLSVNPDITRPIMEAYFVFNRTIVHQDIAKLEHDFYRFYDAHREDYNAVTRQDAEYALDITKKFMKKFDIDNYASCGVEQQPVRTLIFVSEWLLSLDKKYQQKPSETKQSGKRAAVYSGTRNVYDSMLVSAKSLIANSNVDDVYFLIEDDTFPEPLPDMIHTINVSGQQYFSESCQNYDTAWTYMCLLRAAYTKYFPDYDRILSLDVDTIVRDDVSSLWDVDLSGAYIAGVQETDDKKHGVFAEPGHAYYNFGVIMMNLDKLRMDKMDDTLINTINTTKYGFPEQDPFNIYCEQHSVSLPPEYNNTVYYHITPPTNNPKVDHYAGITYYRNYASYKQYELMPWDEVLKRNEKKKKG